jgi:DNA polymerase-3 subunit delta'
MTAHTLPWIEQPLALALRQQRGHALLVDGPEGVGQYELAMALAEAWLCEDAVPADGQGACGRCAACRLMAARTHPDLLVLVPEALRPALGLGADEAETEKSSKAKPSREIKVEAVRQAVAFAQGTSARGRGKVVLVYPAEQMNGISANALLKTLEEPPGVARFVLATAAAEALLPTIRSRCQSVRLGMPDPAQALPWLAAQGVAEPAVLLAAAGGQPQQALAWHAEGMGAAAWSSLPRQLAEGQAGALAGWPLPRVIGVMQRLCHDLACLAAGARPRYFPPAAFERAVGKRAGGLEAAAAWSRELSRLARNADHPYAAALTLDALVAQARQALRGQVPEGLSAPTRSLHSAG